MIQFRYELESGGWAEARISDEHSSATLSASYISDALGDLVRAVQSLFLVDSAECVWELEPGEVRWQWRRNGRQLSVEVFLSHAVRDSPDHEWRMIRNHLAYAGECDILDFAMELERELQRILDETGLERYQNEWDPFPFPLTERQALQQHIQEESQRRKST